MAQATIFKAFAYMAISYVGGLVARSLQEPAQVKGPRLEGLDMTTSAYGLPISEVKGRARKSGVLIWARELEEQRSRDTEGGGKKGGGGGGGTTITTFKVFGTYAIAICKGPITCIRRMWVDNQLTYDISSGVKVTAMTQYDVFRHIQTTGELPEGGTIDAIRIHYGTETQEPSSVIESFEGVGNVNANRGLGYAVFQNRELK